MSESVLHRVACALLIHDGRAFLAQRSSTKAWYPSVWDLPGGHIESGETAPQALARELREELDIGIVPPTGKPLLHLQEPGEDLTIWRIDEWVGTIRNAALEEHDAIGWFTLDETRALRIASDAYRDMLQRELG